MRRVSALWASSLPSAMVRKTPLDLSVLSIHPLRAPRRLTVTWLPTDTYLSLPLTFNMNNVCQVSTPPPAPPLQLPLSATIAAADAPPPQPSLFAALYPPTLRALPSFALPLVVSPVCVSLSLTLSLSPAFISGKLSARTRLEGKERERERERDRGCRLTETTRGERRHLAARRRPVECRLLAPSWCPPGRHGLFFERYLHATAIYRAMSEAVAIEGRGRGSLGGEHLLLKALLRSFFRSHLLLLSTWH